MDIRVAALSGSVRRASTNTKLLRAAAELAPAGMHIDLLTLRELPFYDADLEAQGMPESVTKLAAGIAAADAVVIASPEYNYSLPAVLKNAIDWLSRVKSKPLAGKPLAIMGTSPGRIGTARMQYHLRQVLMFSDALVLVKPEVMLGGSANLFDDDGAIIDEGVRKLIRAQLDALAKAVDDVRRLAA